MSFSFSTKFYLAFFLLSNGLAGHAASDEFYVNPNTNAAKWVKSHAQDPRANEIQTRIVEHASGQWFGSANKSIETAVNEYVNAAQKEGKTPILVAYNLPKRDCNQYSAGGAHSEDNYRKWIQSFAKAIGSRHAVVILEPDALAQLSCLKDKDKTIRLELITYAVEQFNEIAKNTFVYMDIGHPGWLPVSKAADLLIQAGIKHARGFSLNVSNFKSTEENALYGKLINKELFKKTGQAKSFVIDTSRNGNGPKLTGSKESHWCDPSGRKIGTSSRVNSHDNEPEMLLWIKNPGNADGCAAPASTFVPEIATQLIEDEAASTTSH